MSDSKEGIAPLPENHSKNSNNKSQFTLEKKLLEANIDTRNLIDNKISNLENKFDKKLANHTTLQRTTFRWVIGITIPILIGVMSYFFVTITSLESRLIQAEATITYENRLTTIENKISFIEKDTKKPENNP